MMLEKGARLIVGTLMRENLEAYQRRRNERRSIILLSVAILFGVLLGASLARAEGRLEPAGIRIALGPDQTMVMTSTSSGLLTLDERDLYRITTRALALAQGYRIELSLCTDRVDELRRANKELRSLTLDTPAAVVAIGDGIHAGSAWWIVPTAVAVVAGSIVLGYAIGDL